MSGWKLAQFALKRDERILPGLLFEFFKTKYRLFGVLK